MDVQYIRYPQKPGSRGAVIVRMPGQGGKITGFKYISWDCYLDGVKIAHEYRLKDARAVFADMEKAREMRRYFVSIAHK